MTNFQADETGVFKKVCLQLRGGVMRGSRSFRFQVSGSKGRSAFNVQRLVLCLLLAGLLVLPVWGSRVEGMDHALAPVAETVLQDGRIEWYPLRDCREVEVRISGPEGPVFVNSFEGGSLPWFDLSQLSSQVPDGEYIWELRVRPHLSAEVEDSLRVATEEEDFAELSRLLDRYALRRQDVQQMGAFEVVNGHLGPSGDEDDSDHNQSAAASQYTKAAIDSTPVIPGAFDYDVSGNFTLTHKIGIGTARPSQEIDIVNTSPTMQWESASDGSSWFLVADQKGFDIRRDSTLTSARMFYLHPSAPRPSFWVDSLGNWGNGTSSPFAPLHVSRTDGSAQVLVEDTAGTPAVRTLFQLTNNGAPRFAFENTDLGVAWSFQQSGVGNFLVSLEGSGGPEMQFYQSGKIRMGPAGAANFDLGATGNLAIAGSVTAQSFNPTSDRNLKEGIQDVETKAILDKLQDLPVSYWTFLGDERAVRHIGPMAQDFNSLFGVGADQSHVNLLDVAGVALAAIQALQDQLEEKNSEIQELRERLLKLENRWVRR